MYFLSAVFLAEKEYESNDWFIQVDKMTGSEDVLNGTYYPQEVSTMPGNEDTRVWRQQGGEGVIAQTTMLWTIQPSQYDRSTWQSLNTNKYYFPDSGDMRIPPTSQWENNVDTPDEPPTRTNVELFYYQNGRGQTATDRTW
jgi:hypothetical protein